MNPKDYKIYQCQACGSKNRIPLDRSADAARCGKCGQPLKSVNTGTATADTYNLRCLDCNAKNRIPASRIDSNPKCGKCGSLLETEALFLSQPVMVTDSNFDSQVIKSPLPVLLFAWAPWCPTCGTFAPIIDEFAADSKSKIRVGKINVDANPMLASKFNILSVPYLFIFDNGQMKENMPGGMQKHELMMKMARYL